MQDETSIHMTTGGAQVPTERLNQWGFPAQEFYFYAGNGLWTEVNPNEKTATQLRKEKTMGKAGIPKPKKPTKEELKDECRAFGLPVGGNKADLEERLDRYYEQVADVEGYNDDAKEESQ